MSSLGVTKYSLEDARSEFSRRGYVLLETEFKNVTTKMNYRCPQHPDKHTEISFHKLRLGRGCPYCARNVRLTIEEVATVFERRGYTLISKTYKTNRDKLEYLCPNHPNEIQSIRYDNFSQGQACPKCYEEIRGGENNWNWKGGVTPQNVLIRQSAEYKLWRKEVFEKDKYTCQCCGDDSGGNLEAHHIENFSSNEDLRFEISNGITMCRSCHNPSQIGSFHHQYGTQENNINQLSKYFQSKGTFFKGAFSIEENLKGVFEAWQEE